MSTDGLVIPNSGVAVGLVTITIEYFGDTSGITVFGHLESDGTNHYTFTGPGLIGSENDPTIYVQRGRRYQFINNMGAYSPIQNSELNEWFSKGQYNDGITNNDVSNGTLTWDVQFDTPGTLWYRCTMLHPNMGGMIVVDGSYDFIGQNVGVGTFNVCLLQLEPMEQQLMMVSLLRIFKESDC